MDLTEDEFAGVVKYLDQVANELDADTCLLHQRQTKILQTSDKEVETTDKKPFFGHMLIRKRAGEVENLLELRISVVGNVDAGKSTLLGVLTKNTLDDGRGKARLNLFKHKHEIESGRTSSVGLEVMGFDSKATVISGTSIGKQKITWEDVYTHASKVITFLDLAGHEKYLKTTVFGMTGCSPDFVMLMVGANAGIIGMTKEHLGLALALQVPVFIVVTKIDMCPANVLENTISQINKILKSNGCRKMPLFVKNQADVLMSATHFVSERLCPVFQVSNVDGRGLDLLRTFLNLLHSNLRHKYDVNAPVEYMITDTFSVPGVGTVVSGTIASGIVHAGDTLLLGPDSLGQFVPTVVKSIQRKRVNTTAAYAGQSASFALKKVKRSCITKGMVMVSKSMEPKAVMEFEAEVLILYHSTTIGSRYQAMVHCGGVRQTARIVDLDKAVLRTGDRSIVRFRFMQKPEYLKVGARLLFREGRTKGLGKVTRLIYDGELVDK
ncbi:P-loop containing nucleoside triphosphate hydrolase protein [Gorgonomyces haynaldii]|nr:P-loop containing nucleoside triphosphate hydrolase protein [Gorgonomyces haynaldii]